MLLADLYVQLLFDYDLKDTLKNGHDVRREKLLPDGRVAGSVGKLQQYLMIIFLEDFSKCSKTP